MIQYQPEFFTDTNSKGPCQTFWFEVLSREGSNAFEQILYLKQNKTKQKPKEQNTSCFKNLILSSNKNKWDHTCVYVWLCLFLYICMKQQLMKRNTILIKVQSNFDITFSRVLYCFWVPSFILFQTNTPPNFSLGLNFQRLLLLKVIITKIKTKLSACNVFKWNESKYDQKNMYFTLQIELFQLEY